MLEEIVFVFFMTIICFCALSALFIFITLPLITFLDLLTYDDRFKYRNLKYDEPIYDELEQEELEQKPLNTKL